ncbi:MULTISPECIES: 2-hydroxyacid dehydrogenase [Rhizobium/Agrobacterium group]|jgi:lactate dehydrogenase-like 2-hydroxyacid dehydrogenase|uniref:D-glycerate dehydrogenase n=2 Tax=Rhizobium/Agrobacterium group TaxID=227290 RepID=A0A1B9TED1_AGRTU|nr:MULTISPECIES: D-glycerate dehydrogenase [Rhizobium/Agrobacterium group]AHJ99974.1 glyoxylate reductase [Agrobacterium tumefaciens LBA4213 (Ach5)]AKC05849.1 D-isomer specific 2-hydroxyacid dehydrogenases family protein [Agrobacterium tumefaciens]EHJ97926.1 D-isomer specific 2-hydroxyacid dehydrogenases family protein [Agrobacterium tumefaciens 5A]MDP9560170.1 lactate dehydrogenase-like 2-hydroxyacid dehydrogenase [Rhizobium nepotum]QDG91862.1 D-glycerate dehydrogenase [Rhizobium sp. NIBRBAC0
MTHKKRPTVYITRKLPDVVETRMRELFDAELNIDDTQRREEELVAAMQRVDVLVPTVTDRITAAMIEKAGPQLKLIASFSNGIDHVDVDAAARKGITVTNTPNVLTEDSADITMALVLAVPRRLIEGTRVLANGADEWLGWSPTWMLGRRISGKRIGIVGMGRIGTAVARRAKAFGLSIHYHNRKRVNPATEAELEATYWDSLDQMLARVDIVSVNCPSTPATYHLISARRLALMQPTSYIVNTARGDIIDEAAMIQCLRDGKIAGAGLDVYENEPAINPKLIKLAREGKVVLLPHMGSATIEGRIEMGDKVIINIRTLFDGHRPPNRVLPGRN